MVYGVEADFDFAKIDGTSRVASSSTLINAGGNAFTVTQTISWLSSLRGRVGMTQGAESKTLLYLTGGLAFEGLNSKALISANVAPGTFGASTFDNHNSTRMGWVIGAGAEMAIAPNWSLRGEYLFYDFDASKTQNLFFGACIGGQPCGIATTTDSNNISVLRAGLTYKFGG